MEERDGGDLRGDTVGLTLPPEVGEAIAGVMLILGVVSGAGGG